MRLESNRCRPTLEFLEQRDVPTSSLQATLSNGTLLLQDTTAHDFINVSQANGRISVSGITITSGKSRVSNVDANAVQQVSIYSYGGSCNIDLHVSDATQVAKPATVIAYNGHNTILGGSGNESLYGYGGYNSIYAGAGQNSLYGYNGHNTLIGGTSYNTLLGSGGNNALYGTAGTTMLVSDAITSPDTLVGGSGYNWYYRPTITGQPFASGEKVTDVSQGRSPLCQTAATLASAVQQGYDFSSRIHYLGNNQYQVQLYGAPTQIVTFNGYYNNTDIAVAAGSTSFWPILMLRARLQALGISPAVNYTNAQWDSINQGLAGRLYSVNDALTMFTGKATLTTPVSQANPQALQASLAAGHLVVASSVYQSVVTADGIIGNHCYAVVSVFYQNGMWKVRLYNPWGMDSTNGRTLDSLAGTPPSNDGFITLSWGQFTNPANFYGYTQTR